MVASTRNDAVDRLLAALPVGDTEGSARFAELGFPAQCDEDWRFTSVKPITELNFIAAEADPNVSLDGCMFAEIDGPKLVFVNGHFSKTLSAVSDLPEGVEV